MPEITIIYKFLAYSVRVREWYQTTCVKNIPASHPFFVCAVDLSSQLDFQLADLTTLWEGSSSTPSSGDDDGPALR
jgi:hypothetical protein